MIQIDMKSWNPFLNRRPMIILIWSKSLSDASTSSIHFIRPYGWEWGNEIRIPTNQSCHLNCPSWPPTRTSLQRLLSAVHQTELKALGEPADRAFIQRILNISSGRETRTLLVHLICLSRALFLTHRRFASPCVHCKHFSVVDSEL